MLTASRPPILIVEDVSETRYLLRRVLEIRGYATVEAATGGAALGYLRSGGPVCLMILDMALPDTSGRDVHAEMRRDPALAHIPVVVFSGLPPDEPMPDVVAYVRKGVGVEELLNVVDAAATRAAGG